MRLGVTPVPIPNTMVKTQTAENTILETVWEDRWLPDYIKNNRLALEFRANLITYTANQKLNSDWIEKTVSLCNDCSTGRKAYEKSD